MSDTSSNNTIDPYFVRTQFDEILAGEITSFIKIDSEVVLLSYNLATIACLVIAVERERELLSGSMDFLPERFTKKSFIKKLGELCLEKDEWFEKAVDSVIDNGFLSVDSQGKLKAEFAAFIATGFLDVMFPGMPGMNLVAFVMQMNDEVISGRKSLEYAKTSFIETLKSRGVAVTREKAEQVKSDVSDKKISTGFNKTSDMLKKTNSKKIARIKLRKQSEKPSFYSRDGGYASDNVKVKTLFDKGPTAEELKAAQAAEQAEAEKQQQEEEQKAKKFAEMEERIRKAEEKAARAEQKAKEMAMHKEEIKAAEEAEKKALELEKLEAEKEAARMAVKLKAMEEKLKQAEERQALEKQTEDKNSPDKKFAGDNYKEQVLPSDDIEARIAAFEAELAMPCPVCRKGKVVIETTSAGKNYYTCSDKDCRFVSWDKPYPFPCPMCKNPYLVEFDLPSGEKGLKCPRAGCSYSQDNLLDPAQNLALKAEKKIIPKKKKKRVVRRVRRRR